MAAIRPPLGVWPFVGVLARDAAALRRARDAVEGMWGPIVETAGPFAFEHTDYYAHETGAHILRTFFGFAAPVDPAGLAEAKIRSNALEATLATTLAEEEASAPSNSPNGNADFFDDSDVANTPKAEGAGANGFIQKKSRPVNVDPGYVTRAKVVLASAKDFAHRVYLREGIYAEVTLSFRRTGRRGPGRWTAFPWTFPDFADGRYDAFFHALRTRLVGWEGT